MDRGNRLLRAACTALTAALMAGCSAWMIARALGLNAPWVGAYLLALTAAAAVQLCRRGGAWALGAGAVLALLFGALLAVHLPRIVALVRLLPRGEDVEAAEAAGAALDAARAAAGAGVAYLCACALGALIAGLLCMPSGAGLALLTLLAPLVFALVAREDLNLWAALPGLAAGVAAFGLQPDARRDGVPPVLLIPAVLLAVLALALTPGERVTWEPLERLAERVRSVVEDYIRFTEERMAFSIGDKGYDRAGMIGDSVVSMLGGPASPTQDAVMRVETDADLLLRGTIKRSYTGYSWIDDQTKARYLYYDFTHRRVRDAVFDADTSADSPAFAVHAARVELLESGTSTLFVPAQLSSFNMNLRDAVYYNSTGEIFLTRDVRAGDRYELTARVPTDEEALVSAAAQRMNDDDARYAEAAANYTELPPNIDSRVYALAVELTQNTFNPAEKAFAIQNHLAHNYRYTLDGGFPEGNADFVSWFLLESKEGYCSYFASAMAVMCRMAGLPARYVEGYAVEATPGGETTVTGVNAHAWVEVYLNGLGWVAFDPTAAARAAQGGDAGGDAGSDPGEAGPNENSDLMDDPGALPPDGAGETLDPNQLAPSTSPSPELGATPTPNPGEGAPSPSPDDDAQLPEEDSNDPEDTTPPEDADVPDDQGDDRGGGKRGHAWLWMLLILLALAALGWLIAHWTRRRLNETDPLKLTAHPDDLDEAALLLYRALLTGLALLGFAPQSGETPDAFAKRAAEALGNPDYLRFARGVAQCRYAGRPADVELVRAGRRAYAQFLRRLSRSERLRFHALRLFHGLGSTETIP